MSPHYTMKRRKNGQVSRIAYYRCTSVMRFHKGRCGIRSVNADQLERSVVEHLCNLSRNEVYVENVVRALNRELKQSAAPLEAEAAKITRRLAEIDREIDRFVKALGRGKLSVERLEAEIASREDDRKALAEQLADLERRINEATIRDFDAELLSHNLRDFGQSYAGLEPKEQAEALQCLLKTVEVQRDKLTLEIFEVPGFAVGSKNRTEWLPTQDSNSRPGG